MRMGGHGVTRGNLVGLVMWRKGTMSLLQLFSSEQNRNGNAV